MDGRQRLDWEPPVDRGSRRWPTFALLGVLAAGALLWVGADLAEEASRGDLSVEDEPTLRPEEPSADPHEPPAESSVRALPPPTARPEHTELETPEPGGLRLLAVAHHRAAVAVIDLDRGAVVTHSPGSAGVSTDPVDGAALTVGGTAVVWQDGVVTAFGPDGPLIVYEPDELIHPTWAAPALAVVPTLAGRALWVVQPGYGPAGLAGRADLVKLHDGAVLASTRLPPSTFPVAATPRGLVLNTHRSVETLGGWMDEAGSHRVLELTPWGSLNELARGQALAATGEEVAVLACEHHDPQRGCRLQVLDRVTGERHEVAPPVDGRWTMVTCPGIPTSSPCWPSASSGGSLLLGLVTGDPEQRPTRSHLVVIDDGEATVVHHHDGPPPQAAWDRQGQRILLLGGEAGTTADVTILDARTGDAVASFDAIPSGFQVLTAR